MKKISLILALLAVSVFCDSKELADKLNSKFPVILLGKVTHVSGAYFQASIDWRIKGAFSSDIVTIPTDDSRPFVKVGDRVIVAVNRNLEKPFDEIDLPDMTLTRFDIFEGQSAFRVLRETTDYALVGEIHSRVTREELAVLLP